MINRMQRSTPARIATNTRQTNPRAATPARTESFGAQLAGNPFNVVTAAEPKYVAPTLAAPPAMTNAPASISTAATMGGVLHNSSKSVQITNAKYNEQAFEAYNKAVSDWQANNGARWISPTQFAQTTEPPPPPAYLPTDFNAIHADMKSRWEQGQSSPDITSMRPYYMGGPIFSAKQTS